MGKYMRRKCGRGGAAGDSGKQAAPAVVLGPRTRSRAAVAVSESEANPAKRRKQADEASSDGRDAGDASAGCYLHLRSRRLFMPAASAVAEEEASAARRADSLAAPSGEAGAVGISRCSSTASSTVDVAARERSGGEAEVSARERGRGELRQRLLRARWAGEPQEGDDAVVEPAAYRLQRPGVEPGPGEGRAAEAQTQEVSSNNNDDGDHNGIPLTIEIEDAGGGRDRRVLRRRREGPGPTLRRQVQLRRRAGPAAQRRPVRVDAGGHRLRRRPCELAEWTGQRKACRDKREMLQSHPRFPKGNSKEKEMGLKKTRELRLAVAPALSHFSLLIRPVSNLLHLFTLVLRPPRSKMGCVVA